MKGKEMGVNSQLSELYLRSWDDIEKLAGDFSNMCHPLLIKLNECIYNEADIKVVIFGQETDGWSVESQNDNEYPSIESIMNEYYQYYYNNVKDQNRRPFWNMRNFKYFKDNISDYFEKKEKKVCFIWNNISKIGEISRGKPRVEIREFETKYFNIIEEEMKILDPDLIIFSTGYSRDSYIEDSFGRENVKFEYSSITINGKTYPDKKNTMISKVTLAKLPTTLALRIEHPNRRTLSNNLIFDVIKDLMEGATAVSTNESIEKATFP